MLVHPRTSVPECSKSNIPKRFANVGLPNGAANTDTKRKIQSGSFSVRCLTAKLEEISQFNVLVSRCLFMLLDKIQMT